jgi:hypothetical protein
MFDDTMISHSVMLVSGSLKERRRERYQHWRRFSLTDGSGIG